MKANERGWGRGYERWGTGNDNGARPGPPTRAHVERIDLPGEVFGFRQEEVHPTPQVGAHLQAIPALDGVRRKLRKRQDVSEDTAMRAGVFHPAILHQFLKFQGSIDGVAVFVTFRLTWCTDIHLNFLKHPEAQKRFGEALVKETDCLAVLVTGDISEAHVLKHHLEQFKEGVGCPLYFVLGNHDFYHGSFKEVHEKAATFDGWLDGKAAVELTPSTALVGHGGWYDALYGEPYSPKFGAMSDWFIIQDLRGLTRKELVKRCRQFSKQYAQAARVSLEAAVKSYKNVIFATHYPPFKEATWHEGQHSTAEWLPWFSSKIMGQMLVEVAMQNPGVNILVLCGHTHGSGRCMPLPNLYVATGEAKYKFPDVAGVIEIDDTCDRFQLRMKVNGIEIPFFSPFDGFDYGHIIQPNLTKERAQQVRAWRAEGCTWRKVAELAHDAWGDWMVSGHQLYGEQICYLSATLLGEDPHEDPWN